MLSIRVVTFDHPDARALDAEIQAFYTRVYGGADVTLRDPGEFAPPRGLYLVGYDGPRPVASGGWRAVDADPAGSDVLRPGDAEIKRMYVVPDARGFGHSRTVLAELERTAAAAGRTRIVLETGDVQPEALALYAGSGYVPIPCFGRHRTDPRSRCFAKPLG